MQLTALLCALRKHSFAFLKRLGEQRQQRYMETLPAPTASSAPNSTLPTQCLSCPRHHEASFVNKLSRQLRKCVSKAKHLLLSTHQGKKEPSLFSLVKHGFNVFH